MRLHKKGFCGAKELRRGERPPRFLGRHASLGCGGTVHILLYTSGLAPQKPGRFVFVVTDTHRS